jgi:hypothetical protein
VTSVLFILFFQFFLLERQYRESQLKGDPAIELQHPKKLLKNLCSLATYNNME